MRRIACLSLTVGLLLGVAATAAAAPPRDQAKTPPSVEGLLASGWTLVEPDVLRRVAADGSVEHVAFGRAGYVLERRLLAGALADLERRAGEYPSSDLLEVIASHRRVLVEIEDILARHDEGSQLESVVGGYYAPGCSHSVSVSAQAGPTSTGPSASADASVSDTCNHPGDAYAEAVAEGYTGSVFDRVVQTDGPNPIVNGSASAHAAASVSATTNCYARGYARVRLEDDLGQITTWFDQKTSTVCRPPLTATITECDWDGGVQSCTGFCFGTATGGVSPYSPVWKRDSTVLRSGTWSTKVSCSSWYQMVVLEVTDASGTVDTDYWPCCAE